jgi:hypothetical protein
MYSGKLAQAGAATRQLRKPTVKQRTIGDRNKCMDKVLLGITARRFRAGTARYPQGAGEGKRQKVKGKRKN